MDIVETIFKALGLAILVIMFIGSLIEKTAVEGYQDKDGFHRGKKK